MKFPKETNTRARTLELIHVDVCNLINPNAFGKKFFFLSETFSLVILEEKHECIFLKEKS